MTSCNKMKRTCISSIPGIFQQMCFKILKFEMQAVIDDRPLKPANKTTTKPKGVFEPL